MESDSSPSLLDDLLTPPGEGRRAHLLGICGAGMSALAEVLHDRGWIVSGCDMDPDPQAENTLRSLGISVQCGHDSQHLTHPGTLVLFSPAVPASNPERVRARELGMVEASYVAALAALTRQGNSLAISGTHGKSTTTGMLGTVLSAAGRSPTVLCGAELLDRHRSGWGGTGSDVVVEACEYRQHFLQLAPQVACVLGIEPDHFDCYPTLESAADAYRQFARLVPEGGTVVWRRDCPVSSQLMSDLSARSVTFAVHDQTADWHARDVKARSDGTAFTLCSNRLGTTEVMLKVPGIHNVANALAAAACAAEAGLILPEIAAGLGTFAGLRRRAEWKDSRFGARVLDDYAHHPSEVAATLAAARQVEPNGRLLCVFQPHQVIRTQKLFGEFAAALAGADRVYLLPIYAAREGAEARRNLSRELAEQVSALGTPAVWIETLDHVWPTLQTDARYGDLILTLGAGDLTRVHYERI